MQDQLPQIEVFRLLNLLLDKQQFFFLVKQDDISEALFVIFQDLWRSKQ